MNLFFWVDKIDVEALAYQLEHFDEEKEPILLSDFYVNRSHVQISLPYKGYITLYKLNLIKFR